MELNQLDYFRTVARLENMTKAAEELYVSQPNLSTSIARLESNLGVQLFTRSKGHIHLTEAGRQFLAHVEQVFSELDTAVYAIQEGQEYRQDSVALAASFAGLLPRLFPYYYQDYGLLPTTQMLLPAEEIGRRLTEGSLDLGIVAGQVEGPGLVWEPICTSPLVAVLRETNPMSMGNSAPLSRFSQAHFICNTAYYEKELLTALCGRAGFEPYLVRVSNEQEAFDERSFDFGDNVTLCPLHIIPELTQTEEFHLKFLPLEDETARVEIGLLRSDREPRTPFITEFCPCAKEYVKQVIQERNEAGRAIITMLHQ